MKKSTIIIISAAAVCVIALCTLFLTGVLKFPWGQKKEESPKKAELYVEYMNECMLIDHEGYVIGSVSEPPTDIPKVSGITFSSIITGEKLKPQEEEAYGYARRIVDSLQRNAIPISEVYISSDLQATLYVNSVKILLGSDNKTEEKLRELRDFYDDFKVLSGTLDMQEIGYNNLGFSFKQN